MSLAHTISGWPTRPPSPQSVPAITFVGQAVRWLAEHYDQPIRIVDLAAHVGVSVPTLNRHFRALTAMSPLQYQKRLRLQRARVELLAAPGDVAAIGYAVG